MQHFKPREYQRIAVGFLLNHPRCALWAVPGLGKTASVYSALDALKLAGSNFFPVLVLAPKKVCELTWPREQRKWDAFRDLRVVTILGDRDDREDALFSKADVYVINYDNVQWLVERLGDRWPFKIVVADESTRLKNYRSKGHGGKRAHALSTIAEKTGRWINLTGTPSPNGLKDLWGQTWFLDFGQRLGTSYTQFKNRWFYENAYSRDVSPRKGADAEIHAAVADITLALRAEDWLDVKQTQYFKREVELPAPTRGLYERMERDFFIELDRLEARHEVTALNSAVLSSKLLQMSSSGVYDGDKAWHHLHDSKIEALRSLIDELGEPILVPYWFRPEVVLLQRAFPELRIFKTQKDQDDWNAGKIPVMAIQPASAGHGIDLQWGGRTIAFFTQTWDLELRQQVIERLGPVRQLQAGFDRAVLIYDIIARDTMDLEVSERVASKRSVQDALMLARARRRGEQGSDLI